MKRFLGLLTILFALQLTAFAQTVVSFKSLGHDDDAITGISGSSSYFLRIDPLVELSGSKLVLFLEPSQALTPGLSFVNVLINDKPAYSGRLTKDSIQRITVNLSSVNLSADKALNIRIKTLLSVPGINCKDVDNPAMWVKVKNNSYLSLQHNHKNFVDNVHINNCFSTMKAIVYPSNPSLHDLKAVAWAYTRLKNADVKHIAVYDSGKLPDSVKSYVMVGNIDHLPADQRNLVTMVVQKGEGMICLNKGTAGAETASPAEILFITGGDDAGYEKAINALGNTNVLNSTFGDYVIFKQADNILYKGGDLNRSSLSFRQVGGSTSFMSGAGVFKNTYHFKNSDFSFTPKDIDIRVIANYSSLVQSDRGYLNIYLNGLLINAEKLDGSGKVNTLININRYQHQKNNTLETEFRFYSAGDNCTTGYNGFFAEVDVDKSYLESKSPFVNSDLSFYQYPEAFNSGTTRIVVSKKYTPYAGAALGEILYDLNNNISSNNFPVFEYADEANKSDLKKSNVIALLSHDDPLLNSFPDAPIRFDEKFRLYNNENNQTLYTLTDSVSNGLAQIFYGRSNNSILILTATGANVADGLLAATRSITGQLSSLSSNVAVSDVQDNKYLFNISKSSQNLQYLDTKNELLNFWEVYNLYILLGLLILILISFLAIRARVQKPQGLFNE